MTITDDTNIDIVDVDIDVEIDVDPRFAQRRAEVHRHRSSTLRRRAAAAAAVIVVLGAAVFSLFSPLLDVDTVVVHGAETLDVVTILENAGVSEGDPMVTSSPGAIVERLEAQGDVARASVTRRWPSALDVRVTPREAVVQFRWPDGGAVLSGSDGVVVTPAAVGAADARVVAVAAGLETSADTLPEVLANVAHAVAVMPSDIAGVAESMIVTADEQLLINLVSGTQVKFGDAASAEEKFASLSTTLSGQVDLEGVCGIDVRLISPVTMLRGATCSD